MKRIPTLREYQQQEHAVRTFEACQNLRRRYVNRYAFMTWTWAAGEADRENRVWLPIPKEK